MFISTGCSPAPAAELRPYTVLITSHCCSAHKKSELCGYNLTFPSQRKLRSFSIWPFTEKLASLCPGWLFHPPLKPPIPLLSSYLRDDHVFYLPEEREAVRENFHLLPPPQLPICLQVLGTLRPSCSVNELSYLSLKPAALVLYCCVILLPQT